MRRRRLVFVAALGLSACGLFPSLDDLMGGADGGVDVAGEVASPMDSGDAGASDVAVVDADADAGPCVSQHGPAMVFVPTSSGGFCIDSTEVTTTDYAAFVSAVAMGAPVTAPASGVCAWNASVAPLASSSNCTTDTTDPNAHPNRPVACIDWCDAYAYCAWAGKRLCGAIDGGVLPFSSYVTTANQAYVACSTNATQAFPYGTAYVKGNCNTKDLYEGGVSSVVDTKSFSKCVGGFPGIYDITGNVEEWTDSCLEKGEGGANDPCHESGDCFDYTATGFARCDNNDSDSRTARGPDIGVRCCSP